jgi:hypothetical protein
LYETFAVPAPGLPLFQAAAANLNPWTEAKVDTESQDRGPLLLISGEKDHTVPWAITNASFKVAVVTGAGKGIGLAVTKALAADPARH